MSAHSSQKTKKSLIVNYQGLEEIYPGQNQLSETECESNKYVTTTQASSRI